MTLAIREAVAADRPAMLDLWVAAWTATMPHINFEARRDWLDQNLDGLARSGAAVLVACDDMGVAGFVTVDPASGDLDQLVVAAERSRRGIGAALIAAAKALSPRGLSLSVNVDNPRALAFYRRAGFVVSGEGINARSGLPTLSMTWRPLRS